MTGLPEDTRVLTVRQPYAWAIAAGYKPVENRGARFPHYEGAVLIHAGAAWSWRGAGDPQVIRVAVPHLTTTEQRELAVTGRIPADAALFTFSAVLAVVTVTGPHVGLPDCCGPWGETEYVRADSTTERHVTHLPLTGLTALPVPVPARGRQGLPKAQPDLLAAVTAQLR